MTIDDVRARLEAVRSQLQSIHDEAGEAALNEEQTTRWAELESEETTLRDKLATAEAVAASRAKWNSMQVGAEADPFDALRNGGRGVSRGQFVDAVLKANEGRVADMTTLKGHLARHGNDREWATQILARSRPEYASGFSKLMTGNHMALTEAERAAMAVGTSTSGGVLVPTHLDPTLIVTNAGTSNAIRGISRVVTLVGGANTWHGVTTAGVTASWDAELNEVSDDSPAFGGVAIPTYMAQALVQASIQAFEDIQGLESDVLMLLTDARDRLEGAAHATGAGGTTPKGVFTAVAAVSGSRVVSGTAATIALADLNSVYLGVPVRHRPNSMWCMNPTYSLAIKGLGTALSASYTANLVESTTSVLMGRPVVESDDAPSTQTTTALDQEVLLGNFANYVIVDKPGSLAVEFIPHLFHTGNNLPAGIRGWYMHWRNGADVTDANAFRLLVDKTTA